MRRRIKGRLRFQLYFFFLIGSSYRYAHCGPTWVGTAEGLSVGGVGEGGRGACPMPVTGQGPPGRGQGACHRVFWAQKLVKLGDFREQSQNLV